jgi:hypothetical protein
MFNKAKYLFIFGVIIFHFTSCKNEIKQDAISTETAINTDSSIVSNSSVNKYPVWILEFQKLRQALYQNDTAIITTFFDFPLTDEQADGLKAAFYFNTNKELNKSVKLNHNPEFQKYCNQIFPSFFVKGLLSVNVDSLENNNFARCKDWKLPNDNASYHASVSYDDYEKSLSLLLNAAYGRVDDNNEEDEIESATVFIFKLDKNNKLKFDRIEMAG